MRDCFDRSRFGHQNSHSRPFFSISSYIQSSNKQQKTHTHLLMRLNKDHCSSYLMSKLEHRIPKKYCRSYQVDIVCQGMDWDSMHFKAHTELDCLKAKNLLYIPLQHKSTHNSNCNLPNIHLRELMCSFEVLFGSKAEQCSRLGSASPGLLYNSILDIHIRQLELL